MDLRLREVSVLWSGLILLYHRVTRVTLCYLWNYRVSFASEGLVSAAGAVRLDNLSVRKKLSCVHVGRQRTAQRQGGFLARPVERYASRRRVRDFNIEASHFF